MSTAVAIALGALAGGAFLLPRLARAASQGARPGRVTEGAVARREPPLGDLQASAMAGLDPVMQCPVAAGEGPLAGVTVPMRRSQCDEYRALREQGAERWEAEQRRCNRTPERLCRDNPAFCARAAGNLAGSSIVTVASAGLGWPSLVPPATEFAVRLSMLPCEADNE